MDRNTSSGSIEVQEFLKHLDHPLKTEIMAVREIILHSNNKLTEHIKWNAPSFGINGEDRVTMKLFPPKNIQLILHRGAKVKKQPAENLISGYPSMLKWAAKDRAVVTFNNMAEIKTNGKVLSKIINKWIDAADATV